MNLPATDSRTPFDRIKHTDARGDYWLARVLQPLLGYDTWEYFQRSIDRAIIAIDNIRAGSDQHIRAVTIMDDLGTGYPRQDYRLTRFGAYMVAMNGDPRKPEIAAAMAYFAIRTQQAEDGPQMSIEDMIIASATKLKEANARIEQLDGRHRGLEQNQISTVRAINTLQLDVAKIKETIAESAKLGSGYATSRGWMKLAARQGRLLVINDTTSAHKLGIKAARISREKGLDKRYVSDDRNGQVRSYSVDILELAATELGFVVDGITTEDAEDNRRMNSHLDDD